MSGRLSLETKEGDRISRNEEVFGMGEEEKEIFLSTGEDPISRAVSSRDINLIEPLFTKLKSKLSSRLTSDFSEAGFTRDEGKVGGCGEGVLGLVVFVGGLYLRGFGSGGKSFSFELLTRKLP